MDLKNPPAIPSNKLKDLILKEIVDIIKDFSSLTISNGIRNIFIDFDHFDRFEATSRSAKL